LTALDKAIPNFKLNDKQISVLLPEAKQPLIDQDLNKKQSL